MGNCLWRRKRPRSEPGSPVARNRVREPLPDLSQLLLLPDEMQLLILTFLPSKELCRMSRSCKTLKNLADSNEVWIQLLCQEFASTDLASVDTNLPLAAKRAYMVLSERWESCIFRNWAFVSRGDGMAMMNLVNRSGVIIFVTCANRETGIVKIVTESGIWQLQPDDSTRGYKITKLQGPVPTVELPPDLPSLAEQRTWGGFTMVGAARPQLRHKKWKFYFESGPTSNGWIDLIQNGGDTKTIYSAENLDGWM
eukprot:TRINITY_DN15708_c0_g1_i1.p1 TRINITY_DN15708_c0_g1~~TRINITY_DN15708_c0_g1_i1.p1  ORF type:complete len:253 (-),score=19.88 TRINITY_DN15708_c0_g1_i1:160-918(-)